MNDNEAAVRIVGDASGVAPAIDQTKAQMASLTAVVEAASQGFREGFGEQLRANMAQGAAATENMTQEMRHLEAETEKERLTLREMALSVHEGVESFNGFKRTIMEVGEAYLAFFAVERFHEMAEKMGDGAEKLENLSQTLGLTTQRLQALQAATAAIDLPFETLQKGMSLLDKKFETDPKLFKKLGIDISAGADQMTILNAVMDKFKDTADGPNKTALAMELMGKSGAAMIPFLNQGADGLADITRKAEEYGAVNEKATERGLKLAEAMDEGKIATMGLGQTMTEAFAPLLTTMADGFNGLVRSITASYEAGGAMKVVFDGISELFAGFGEVINAVGALWREEFSDMGSNAAEWGAGIKIVIEALVNLLKLPIFAVAYLADAFRASFDLIGGAGIWLWGKLNELFENIGLGVTVTGRDFQTFGKVAYDALTLNWGSIASDWNAGLSSVDNVVRQRGAQIVADAKATSDQANKWFAAAGNVAAGFKAFSSTFWDSEHKPAETGIKPPKAVRDSGPDLSKLGKEKKPRAEKDDLVQQLEAELTAKKLAWSIAQDAQGTAQAYSLQSEADYWQAILQRTDLSAKDRAEIETKYLAAHSQLTKERIAIVIDGFKQEIAEADKNATAKLAIAERELAYVGKTFGTESKEYAAAQAEIVKIKMQAAEQIRQIDDIRAKAVSKANLDQIAAEEAAAKQRVAMGAETDLKLLAEQKSFEDRRYAIQLATAQRELAAVNPNRDPVKYAQLNAQLEQLERTHQANLTSIDRQAELQRATIQRTAINSIASSWGQAFGKLVTMQQGFGASVKQLWQGLQSAIGNALASIAEQWLVSHLSKLLIGTAASKAAGASEISTAAAIAGANGVASMALAPFPLDLGAPAFGASMATAAAAFGTVSAFSAEGGMGDVPYDNAPFLLHKNEMVLPSNLATPLRSMLTASDGPSNGGRSGAANDPFAGGFHYHDHTEKGVSASDIIANRPAIAKAMKMAHRELRVG